MVLPSAMSSLSIINYIFFIFIIHKSSGRNNGVALTPPMGWISYERYRHNYNCVDDPYNCLSESLLRSTGNFELFCFFS